jgi:hypothetical protein
MHFPLSVSRFAVVWLSMAVAMSANGIARELLLKRFLNGRAADVISAIIGIVLIALITRWGFRPMSADSPGGGQLALVSVALVVLTVVFETVLGRYVDHKTWPQILEHYALWHGELWLIVLAWLAFTPFLWGRR